MYTNYIKRLIQPKNLSNKIRLGSLGDCGYVVSKDCLDQTSKCYSLGVGDNISFDLELANRNIPVMMYDNDPSVNLSTQHDLFTFKRKTMTSAELTNEIVNNGDFEKSNMLLKIDIEGGEYELLQNIDWQVLDCFNQICIEMHWIHNPSLTQSAINVLEKLSRQFILIHAHSFNGARNTVDQVPEVLELTYINNMMLENTVHCPDNTLDYISDKNFPEIPMDWW